MEIAALVISIIAFFISVVFSLLTFKTNRVNKFKDNIAELDKMIIDHPELIYIYDNKEVEKRKENEDFYNKIQGFIYLHFNIFTNIHHQYLSKIYYSQKNKKIWEDYIIETFQTNLVKELWKKDKHLYNGKFTKYVDKLRERDENDKNVINSKLVI